MTPRRSALVAGLVLGVAPGSASGQISASIAVGETADALTGVSAGTSVFLSTSYAFDRGGLSAGAGLPLSAGTEVRWGTASGWVDRPGALPALDLGLLAAASAFAYDDPVLDAGGGAGVVDLQTYRPFDVGPARVRARVGARAGTLLAGGGRTSRALGRVGLDATLSAGPAVLRAGTDAWLSPEAVYPEVSVSGITRLGPASVWGRVTRWLSDELSDTGWRVGLELGLLTRLALTAEAAEPAPDILFFSPAQRSWSVGVRYGLRPPPPRAIPVPVFAAPGQRITLQVATSAADGPVRLAGSFNDWQPEPMRRDRDRWVAELRLPPGIYEFAFVSADDTWFVPEGTPGRKADGYGGFVATIVVR